MKALLTAVKKALQDEITGVRTADIFITPDEAVILSGAMIPCYGIKDGSVKRMDLAGNVQNKKMQVTIIAWADQGKDDAQIMGDKTQDGVLDMTQQVEDILLDNLLAITGMIGAEVVSETPSRQFINDKGRSVQQKTITFEFEREL
jgi:hypothetical protein